MKIFSCSAGNWGLDRGLAYLQVGFYCEEGICFHCGIADADDGWVGEVHSEEGVHEGKHFDGLGDGEGRSSPFEPRFFAISYFKLGKVEEVVVLLMPTGNKLFDFLPLDLGSNHGDAYPGCYVFWLHSNCILYTI